MAKKGAAAAVDFTEGDSLMVDLNEVEDISFEVMPRGLYPCVIADCEYGMSQNSGNRMWTLQLEVNDGDYAGRKLFTHMVWEGKGLPFTKKQIARIRPDLLEGPFDPESPEVLASMLGLEVKAKVLVKKWDGEDRNNVGDLFPSDGDSSFV